MSAATRLLDLGAEAQRVLERVEALEHGELAVAPRRPVAPHEALGVCLHLSRRARRRRTTSNWLIRPWSSWSSMWQWMTYLPV